MRKPTKKYTLLRELLQKEIAKVIQTEGLSRQDYVKNTTQESWDVMQKLIKTEGLKAKRGYVTPSGRSVVFEYDSRQLSMMDRPNGRDMARYKQDIAQDVQKLKSKGIQFAVSGIRLVVKLQGTGWKIPGVVVREASTDQPGPAAPPVPPVTKAQPKPVAPPIKQPDPKAKPKTAPEPKEDDDTSAQVVAMTNNLIQKIKHTVGVPEADDIAEALTSLIQAWGFNSEQKLTILKSVRNNSIR